MRAIKQTPVCSNCKSTDITVPAFVCWSDEIQDWQIAIIEDYGNCGACGRNGSNFEWLDSDAADEMALTAKDSLPVDWFPREFSNYEVASWHAADLLKRGHQAKISHVDPNIFTVTIVKHFPDKLQDA